MYIYPAIRVEIYIRTDAFPKVIVRMLFCCVGNTTKLKKPTFITERTALELSEKEAISFRIAQWIS